MNVKLWIHIVKIDWDSIVQKFIFDIDYFWTMINIWKVTVQMKIILIEFNYLLMLKYRIEKEKWATFKM